MIPLSAFGSFFAKRPERAPGGGLVPAARLSSPDRAVPHTRDNDAGPGAGANAPTGPASASPITRSLCEDERRDDAGPMAVSPRHSPSGPASPSFASPSVYCRSCDRSIPDPICIATDDGHVVSGFCRRCGVATNRVIQPLNSYRLDEAAA